ncbi:beta-glucosidase [Microbacter margulisiae]|uniref:Beta-glucosidase n=1 Tax=Microbacter margulisiae TaxID=1350067 RepID=A0A7W5H044_9PORP|nr:glycoside hydrolase family 3 C-terminal domain-containing protein [Microbacter margulisiae]MBB3186138.1 beta-glucosidase [Microbacter margulisiae]
MKKFNLSIGVWLISASLFAQVSQTLPQLGKDSIKKVIAAMTLQEKVDMVMGLGDRTWKNPDKGPNTVLLDGAAGRTYDIPRLGITPAVLTDGPAGLRIEPKQEGQSHPFYCTAFPTATVMASTWNTAMEEKVGEAMGNEVLEYGSDVLLAPALNIQRNPLCGRNFEYFSEDPLIAGKMAAALVRGIQSNGVGTSIKHFDANNIETDRTTVNAVVSQRALHEIYLKGFEIAVKEGNPWTVMSSYNRLNGFYTSQNHDLLTTILRKEWGYKGMVMSDWWGGDDPVAQMKAGNDLLEPGDTQRSVLMKAVEDKTLSEKTLDRNIASILQLIEKTPRFKGFMPTYQPDLAAHAAIAREAATEGMVLLKNDNDALPFTKKIKHVALFGKTSYHFMVGGTGSGEVNYDHAASVDNALLADHYKLVPALSDLYKQFVDSITNNAKKQDQKFAVDFAPELPLSPSFIDAQVKNSDIAVITIGRQAGEGADRTVESFSLSTNEKALIHDVCQAYHAAKKKVIVVLNIGGPIETADWRNEPDAIMLAWQPGQQGAYALTDLLKGIVDPSGRLAVSFPMKYTDVPSASTFPGEPKNKPVNAFYNEGIYVGYRYYETFHVPTAYPFGYGLSYTKFRYSDLALSDSVFNKNITVTVKVTNIGKVAGKEVVELYLDAPKKQINKPLQELKAFAKTHLLKPNESQTLTFTLNPMDLASFWSGISSWVADQGSYQIRVGASSEDIRTKATFTLPHPLIVEKDHDVLYPNFLLHTLTPKEQE